MRSASDNRAESEASILGSDNGAESEVSDCSRRRGRPQLGAAPDLTDARTSPQVQEVDEMLPRSIAAVARSSIDDRQMCRNDAAVGFAAMPPRDPVVALASSLQASPGAYAALLGSGLSQAAGVLTGWDIALDLVRRLASAEGEPTPDNLVAWYAVQHGGDVDYSTVLETLAPSPGDRHALLDPYFEPTAADRQEGRKSPTRAHRALAELVGLGLIKIIVTTNFDRLTERALQDAGIEPLVIASSADAASAPPLHSVRCLVIKVNGDRMSPNLKNTLEELEEYEPEMADLLTRVFDDYGLIVCGWSGDWDPGLRSLACDHQPKIYSTFWAHRGEPTAGAQMVIKDRAAIPFAIEDADTFFEAVTSKVQALRDLQQTQPHTIDVAVAEIKRLVPDPVHRVRLQEVVGAEVERVVAATTVDNLPVSMNGLNVQQYMQRLETIEAACKQLGSALSTLAYYGDEERHDELLVRAVERLSTRAREHSGLVALLPTQLYPALLALYSVGLAALASRRIRPIALIFATITVPDISGPGDSSAYRLAPIHVLDYDTLRQTDQFQRHYTPCSDAVHVAVRPWLAPVIPDDFAFDDHFDDLEYVLGLAAMDSTDGRWGSDGQFTWRQKYLYGNQRPDRIVATYGEELVKAGMFQGSFARLSEMRTAYDAYLERLSHQRF